MSDQKTSKPWVAIHERSTPWCETIIHTNVGADRRLLKEGRVAEIIQKMDGSSIVVIDTVKPTGILRRRRYAQESAYEILKEYERVEGPFPQVRNSIPLQIAKSLRLVPLG